MDSNNSNGSRATSARGFAALCAVLTMGLGLMALPAAAAPFAYVTDDSSSSTVSVIDTGTTSPAVVATIPVGEFPPGVAVAPDGKHVYVVVNVMGGVFPPSANFLVIDTATNKVVATVPTPFCFAITVAVAPDGKHAYVLGHFFDPHDFLGGVSVIDTATNTVVATIDVGSNPDAIAVSPDGKHVYVQNDAMNELGIPVLGDVSVIDTATNTVTADVGVGVFPHGFAVNPDGKHAYVASNELTDHGEVGSGNVMVIDTATNMVVATIPVGQTLSGVAVNPDAKHVYVTNFDDNTILVIDTATNTVTATIQAAGVVAAFTPDGKHAYVANSSSNSISVIATATNTVTATIPVAGALAFTPDGKHAYVTNFSSNSVSVIDTATNTVEAATIPVGTGPTFVGIVPPPPGVPFLAFSAKLAIQFGSIPTKDAFGFGSNFTLSSTAPAINPLTDPVTLQIGTFTTTIPPGSFKKQQDGSFTFEGKIHGVGLGALIKPSGTLRYTFEAQARGANLTGTVNTVYATLAVGGGSFSNSNSGATSVTANISH